MKKKLALFLFAVLVLTLANCDKNDDLGATKKRDYQEQYDKDIADIELFLKTHTYTVVNHPGQQDDQDVTFTQVPEGTAGVIWDELGTNLWTRTVNTHRDEDKDIDYKVYYLKLREGGGASGTLPKPTNTDKVLAAYTGTYMFHYESTDEETGEVIDSLKTNEFESQLFPQSQFDLQQVIKGWSEIFPLFRGGDPTQVEGEPTLYTNFGAGVMFIPSGLGYYNQAVGSIPTYSPLIFTFKLLSVTHVDTDQDGIPDYLEDIDGDGYMYIIINEDGTADVRPDDTDGDGAPNYLDLDDDGDNILTKEELRRPQVIQNGVYDYTKYYYSYNGAAEDDPATPYDDRLGAPSCLGGERSQENQCNYVGTFDDYTNPARTRNYLDRECTQVNRWLGPNDPKPGPSDPCPATP